MSQERDYMIDTGMDERLREARKKKGLSQKDVAYETGISQTLVSRWENGWNCPKLFHLDILADLYGVSVDWLMGRLHHGEDQERGRPGFP